MVTSALSQSVTSTKRKFYEVSTVALILGENQKSFYVHLDLLCGTSPFFKAAFTKNFKETFEKEMSLPEDDESIFELFTHWLYYKRYEMLPEVEKNWTENDGRFLQACRLFVCR